MEIRNTTRGTTLADRATRADGWMQRLKGLLGRDSLQAGEGLHIDPCTSIHTFFMRFPIDVLFIDTEGMVVRAFESIRPWRATRMYPKARSVVELPVGTLKATETYEGDVISFSE